MNPNFRVNTPSLAAVDDFDDLVGNIMLRIDIYRFLQYQIIFFRLSHLFDHLIGFFKNLLEFFILTGVEVFLKLAAFALKLAVLVSQLTLTRRTLSV